MGAATPALAELAKAGVPHEVLLFGISPFGQRRRLRMVLDSSALNWDRVLCSAGRRGWDVGVSPHDLILVTGAITADIARTTRA